MKTKPLRPMERFRRYELTAENFWFTAGIAWFLAGLYFGFNIWVAVGPLIVISIFLGLFT